jgi:hypothetical protein
MPHRNDSNHAVKSECREYAEGRNLCGVAEFMHTTNVTLSHLMQFKETASDKLDKIEHLESSLQDVARHAKSMDDTLKSMASTGRELIEVATGKRQVPITIVYLVVFVLGAWMLLDKLNLSRANLTLSPTSMKYESHSESRNDPDSGRILNGAR